MNDQFCRRGGCSAAIVGEDRPYWYPFCVAKTGLTVKEVDVAPPTSLQPPPEFTCHCTVGLDPLAAAVKLALPSTRTLWSAGFVVIAGGVQAVTFRVPLPVA